MPSSPDCLTLSAPTADLTPELLRSNSMEITSLTDHVKTTTGTAITTEWGLSLRLKRNNVSMLFDMASSGHFMDNAAALAIDIYSVDLAVLSHGHYDHGGGLRNLFSSNSKAVSYIGEGADPTTLQFSAKKVCKTPP